MRALSLRTIISTAGRESDSSKDCRRPNIALVKPIEEPAVRGFGHEEYGSSVGTSNNHNLENPGKARRGKIYFNRKSSLAGYWYAKGGRKWNRADQTTEGMRWNYYLAKGKTTPLRVVEEEAKSLLEKIHAESSASGTAERDNISTASSGNQTGDLGMEDIGMIVDIATHPKFKPKVLDGSGMEDRIDIVESTRIEGREGLLSVELEVQPELGTKNPELASSASGNTAIENVISQNQLGTRHPQSNNEIGVSDQETDTKSQEQKARAEIVEEETHLTSSTQTLDLILITGSCAVNTDTEAFESQMPLPATQNMMVPLGMEGVSGSTNSKISDRANQNDQRDSTRLLLQSNTGSQEMPEAEVTGQDSRQFNSVEAATHNPPAKERQTIGYFGSAKRKVMQLKVVGAADQVD